MLELYREGLSSDDEETGSEAALFNTELGTLSDALLYIQIITYFEFLTTYLNYNIYTVHCC